MENKLKCGSDEGEKQNISNSPGSEDPNHSKNKNNEDAACDTNPVDGDCSNQKNNENTNWKKKKKKKTRKKKNSGCDNSVGSSSNEIKHTEKEDNSTHCSLRDCEDKILHVEGNEESDSMKAVDGEFRKITCLLCKIIKNLFLPVAG